MADQEDEKIIKHRQQKEAEDYEKKVRISFEEVAQTEAGQVLFGYLMKKCLFHESTIALSTTGDINTNAMIHNEARRRLYLRDIRLFIPVNIRRKIEN